MAKSQHKIKESLFFDITTPEVAYFLGYLWADGHIWKDKYTTSLTISHDDMEQVVDIFKRIGDWTFYYKKKNRPTHKDQIMMYTSNKYLNEFLIENGYQSKSTGSACKILSKMPKHLTHYWFRGLIDGDGCFYLNEYRRKKEVFVASSYNQDWTFIIKLLENMNIVYEIRKYISKLGKGSTVRIQNGYGIDRFGEYIYQNYDKDGIGLSRKYRKFLELKKHISNEKTSSVGGKTSKYIGVRKLKSGFKVIVKINQKIMSFHSFKNEKDAASFYDRIAKFEFGDRTRLNRDVFREDFADYEEQEIYPSKSMLRIKYKLYKGTEYVGEFSGITKLSNFLGVHRIAFSRILKKSNLYKEYEIRKEIYHKYEFGKRKSELPKVEINTSYGLKNLKIDS